MASPKSRPNYFYTILSLSLVLFLLGGLAIMMMYAQRLMTILQDRVEIMAELSDTVTDMEKDSVVQFLYAHPGVRSESIQFISRESAAEEMQRELGEEFSDLDLDNPLRDTYVFAMRSGYLQSDTLTDLRSLMMALPGVSDVYYQKGLTDKIGQNIRHLSWITLLVALLGLGIAALLIHNTIRLALYANRFQIKNMQLVGATWGYISRPYLLGALHHAAISTILAIGALSLSLWYVGIRLPEFQNIRFLFGEGLVFVVLLFLALSVSLLSTWYVVSKYLRLRVDDLY